MPIACAAGGTNTARSMSILRKFLKREAANDSPLPHRIDVRPLGTIATPKGRVSDIAAVMASPEYADIRAYLSL